MSDLSFPEIAAPVEAPRTDVATAAIASLDLQKLDLTDLALAQFGDWRAAVAMTRANLSTLAIDLSTQAKVDDAKSLRHRLINVPRAEARKVAKELKSKLAKVSKDIGAAEDTIVAAWDGAEALITPQIEKRQAELDAEKAERQRAEAARVQMHQENIAKIRAYLPYCQQPGFTAERIASGIDFLRSQSYGPEWEEFQVPAANAQCETLEAMRQLHAQVLGREQEAARQEAIRLENERQAEANRIEAKRIADEAAEIRRQAAELAAQRAESERIVREAEDALVASLHANSRRIEGRAVAYVEKAIASFETAARDWEADERARVREAVREGRSYLAAQLSAAVNTARAEAHAEAAAAVGVVAAPGQYPPAEDYTDPDPDAATLLPGEPVETVDRDDALTAMEQVQGAQVPQAATPGASVEGAPLPPLPTAPAPTPVPPTLTLGQICERLAPLKLDAAGLIGLGFERQQRPGSAAHFLASDWPSIKAAIVRHVEGLA